MIRGYITVSSIVMLLALPAVAAPVDTRELARCHAMANRDQQLDCYEALATAALAANAAAGPSAAAPTTPTAAGQPGSIGGQSAPTAAAAPTAPPAGQPAPAGPAAGTTDPNDPANFGLTRRQVEPHRSGPSAVESIVSQMTLDRHQNVTVVLENGQTWTLIEPDPRLRPGDSVTIKRASLGSYLMLTPSRRSYRVERLK